MAPVPLPTFVVVLATIIAVSANIVFVWPQAWKVVAGRTAGVAPGTWLLFATIGTVWMVWALTSGNVWLFIANVSSTVAALVILVAGAARHAWRHGWWIGACLIIALGVAVDRVNPAAVIPLVIVSGLVFRLPQIVKAVRADSVAGVSQTTWTLAGVNAAAWFVVSIAHGDWITASANTVAVVSTVILVVVVAARRRASVAASG